MQNLSLLPQTLGRLVVGTSGVVVSVAANADLVNVRTSGGMNVYAWEVWVEVLNLPMAAQELRIEAIVATGFSGSPTVGNEFVVTDLGVDEGADIVQSRISDTGAVTGATYTAGNSLGGVSCTLPAFDATITPPSLYWCMPARIRLPAQTGLVVKLRSAMGGALTMRVNSRLVVGTL